jgi:hypothetical protein
MIEELKKIESPLKRRMLLLGVLTQELENKGVKPVLVGGNALELYSLGGYATADIDIVCKDSDLIGEVLERLDFKKEGRFWINEELEMAVEVPSKILAGSMDRVEIFEIEDFKVYIIGKEDLIVDRLNACVFWRSDEDCRWAKELILLYYDKLDWEYLRRRCKEEGTNEKIEKMKEEVEAMLDELGRVDEGKEE